jgi:hypothetical protein
MKKLMSIIALAAISLGSVSAMVPVKAAQDTTMKMKKKGTKMKKKKMKKDTTSKM